tara:strand:+ start:47 stop:919 length:873 start_codon:yes stop_codon:yes gene_type:complete
MWQRGLNPEKNSRERDNFGKRNREKNRNNENQYEKEKIKNNRNYRDNNSRDNNRNYRDNNRNRERYERNINYYRKEPEVKEVPQQYNMMDHPEIMEFYNNPENHKTSKDYLEICNKTKEEDEQNKILNNPENWRGNVWIGPKIVKSLKYNETTEKYINNARNFGASSIIYPLNIIYSRNGVDWHKSWKETFTEEEWEKMNEQLANEKHEKYMREYENKLELEYQKRKEESYQYYLETGEEDVFAEVERQIREHEKWVEQLENQETEFDEEDLEGQYEYSDIDDEEEIKKR